MINARYTNASTACPILTQNSTAGVMLRVLIHVMPLCTCAGMGVVFFASSRESQLKKDPIPWRGGLGHGGCVGE